MSALVRSASGEEWVLASHHAELRATSKGRSRASTSATRSRADSLTGAVYGRGLRFRSITGAQPPRGPLVVAPSGRAVAHGEERLVDAGDRIGDRAPQPVEAPGTEPGPLVVAQRVAEVPGLGARADRGEPVGVRQPVPVGPPGQLDPLETGLGER